MAKAGKTVVLVGHCGPDSSYLQMALKAAGPDVSVVAADDEATLQRAIEGGVDLALLNRILDYGFEEEEGVEVIARLRRTHPQVKTMLVSNYAEAQASAVAAGALPGFGKRELGSVRVKQLLEGALNSSIQTAKAL